MPSNDQLVFPTPRDWQELQRMTCDLFREIWKDPFAAEFGTLGQRQHGVDVYGKRGESLEGFQCKLTDNLTEKEVND